MKPLKFYAQRFRGEDLSDDKLIEQFKVISLQIREFDMKPKTDSFNELLEIRSTLGDNLIKRGYTIDWYYDTATKNSVCTVTKNDP